jgi:site-specific DNA-methyltransferase (adenine-specific)
MDWVYTGNRLHPTQKSVRILRPIIEAFAKPGDLVLDPFAGSGSTCVAAQSVARAYLGIELDASHANTANARLARLAESNT